jgi:hypothetical protein
MRDPQNLAAGREILKSVAMQAEMHRRASLGKDFAEAIAPYDLNGTTQHYKESFSVVDEPREDRAQAILRNDDDDAIFIEFGTGLKGPRPQGGHSPEYAVMRLARDVMESG